MTDAAVSRSSITASATYFLSEAGRRSSLLTGGTGRARQRATLTVPATDMELVHVDPRGRASLRLAPRFIQHPQTGRWQRLDEPRLFDQMPSPEELIAEARAIHDARQYYDAQRAAERTTRDAAILAAKTALAQQFLADSHARAIPYPAPNKIRAWLPGPNARRVQCRATDPEPLCRVPAEARRRFERDQEARRAVKAQRRTDQERHEEAKRATLSAWVHAHGTDEQRRRFAAGLLPDEDIRDAISDHFFAPLSSFPLYALDGLHRLQGRLREDPRYAQVAIAPEELSVSSSQAAHATPAQWQRMAELRAALPGANVYLRKHTIAWKADPAAPTAYTFSLLVTLKFGALTLRRAYAAPCTAHETASAREGHALQETTMSPAASHA
ncbi:MAG: hypothetical protein GEV06_28015 [Luteitalea sp.]|nr:hypothetical protein [Luteitalea sp.]